MTRATSRPTASSRRRKDDQPGLAVGVWMGNSDHSTPRGEAGDLADRGRPAVARVRPRPHDGLAGRQVRAARRASSRRPSTPGAAASPGPGRATRRTSGSSPARSPAAEHAVDPAGLLYSQQLRRLAVDPLKAELGPSALGRRVADWMARARRGAGRDRAGRLADRLLLGQSSWGGPIARRVLRPRPTASDDQRPRRQPRRQAAEAGKPPDKPPRRPRRRPPMPQR